MASTRTSKVKWADMTARKVSEANTVMLLVTLIEVLPQACRKRESDLFEMIFRVLVVGQDKKLVGALVKMYDEQRRQALETM